MSRRKNPANLSEDLEMLIISQIRLQNKVKRLLNNEDSSIQDAIDQLQSLEDNTSKLRFELIMLQSLDSIPDLSHSDEDDSLDSLSIDKLLEELGESEVESSLQESLQIQSWVDIIESNPKLQDAIASASESWQQDWTLDKKLNCIAEKPNDTRIKLVHSILLSDCKSENKKVLFAAVDLLNYMLEIRNMSFSPEDQAYLYFPEIGTRFDRSEMIATEEVLSGNVIGVLMPGIPKLRLKALVVVR